jgi:thiol-disulfide isomerase/thioredoxin
MRSRWIVAALAALALATLTMAVPLPWPWTSRAARAPATAACKVNAKPANLSFTLKDLSGRNVKLSDFRGKVILLDFWATWCVPCKFEIPGFVALQEKYAKDGLQVIGVSVDDTLEKLQPFVREFKMNYPVLQGLDHDDVQEAFGPVVAIPTSVVISRDGLICARYTGLPPTRSSEGSLEQRVKDEFEHQIKSLLYGEKEKIGSI